MRKPDKSWFVQVHPDESYRIQTGVIELKEDREMYLVDPSLWSELMTSESTFSFQELFTAITRQGTVFIWSIGLPGPDGKSYSWNDTALEAAKKAMSNWVRVTWNKQILGYDASKAQGEFPAPVWPDVLFGELLRIAFKGKLIDSLDHPVLRKLRGEV